MKALISIIALLSVCTLAFAHAPGDIVVSWNPDMKMLSIVVSHSIKESKVPDPAKHFVKILSLKINGNDAAITDYKYQQFLEGVTIVFKLDLKSGDKVSINGKCSLAGEKTIEYTVK